MDANRIGSIVEPVLAGHGLELETVELQPAGRRTVLRVVVDGDGADGRGPGLDEIAEATKSVSSALDDADVAGAGSYTLEVSSRGTARPLTKPAHWRRNVDRLVKITLTGDSDDRTDVDDTPSDSGTTGEFEEVAVTDDSGDTSGSVIGRITASSEDDVTLDVDGTPRTLAFADISKALIQVEFNRKDR